ncbi:MAG: PilZ domain-containing protein [Phycisphaerales bacterium]|nr:PilZ domain-containing protein [Phycisphaerales bacterium]
MNPIPLPSWLVRRRDRDDCRRRTTRISCDQPRCNLGEIVDLSATGARVACSHYFRPVEGKPTTLTITPPRGQSLKIPCVVCWARKRGENWEAGLVFNGLTADHARVLGDYAVRINAGNRRARSA